MIVIRLHMGKMRSAAATPVKTDLAPHDTNFAKELKSLVIEGVRRKFRHRGDGGTRIISRGDSKTNASKSDSGIPGLAVETHFTHTHTSHTHFTHTHTSRTRARTHTYAHTVPWSFGVFCASILKGRGEGREPPSSLSSPPPPPTTPKRGETAQTTRGETANSGRPRNEKGEGPPNQER